MVAPDDSGPANVILNGSGTINVAGTCVPVVINTLGAYTLAASVNAALTLTAGVVTGRGGATAIGGAFAQSNGTINLACDVDSLAVTGAAVFTGGTLNLTGTGTAGTKTLMTTTGGITGTPTLGTIPTGFTSGGLSVVGNNLVLTLAQAVTRGLEMEMQEIR